MENTGTHRGYGGNMDSTFAYLEVSSYQIYYRNNIKIIKLISGDNLSVSEQYRYKISIISICLG